MSEMVAKPVLNALATESESPGAGGGRSGVDPVSLPICLEFGPVLKLLAEAGYTGGRLGEWLIEFNQVNRNLVGKLELTAEGVLLVSPMPSKPGSRFETILGGELYVWAREYGGEAHGARLGVKLPNGACYAPDASWLSPAQLAADAPSRDTWLLDFCPHFVAEIMSRNDRPAVARSRLDEYIANGARLGWLIDPFRRQVHIYRPGAEAVTLDEPERLSGDPELPGFVFEVRALIFDA